jgi:Protein of unknown function (DUF2568)
MRAKNLMANHPINLVLHFVLELVAWFALGYWGWTQQQGLTRWLLAIGLPLIAIALWGTFRVPGDPREAPVAVPGIVRLALEWIILFGGALALYSSDQKGWAIALLVILVLHYAASYDRVLWLIRNGT